jgi:CHAT domain-containing protein
MQMRLIMILFFICASLGPAVYVCGQGLPSEIGGEYAAGKNITGDDCKLRRTKPGGWGGSAEKYALYCEGWSQPSGQLIVLRQGKRPLAWWLEESEWARDIREAGECETPRTENSMEGVNAMARRCQHRLGWRRLMLAAKSGPDLFVADFLPNNAPLIERALLVAMGKTGPAVADVQGKRMVALRAMEELVGKETELPSIKEIGELSELSKLAYHQHEARLYRPSELTWRRVLAAQERFFGLNNPALASTLLNMSHPVRNQRRFDDALALVKRAEPLVLKSRNPILIAQRCTNLAYDAQFRKNHKAAAAFADEAIIALPSVWPGSSGMLAEAYYALAIAKYGLKDYANAERAARQAVELAVKALGSDHTWTNRDRMLLARVLTAQKKFSEAKSHLSEALHSAELMFGQTIWWANAKVLEAGLASAMGNPVLALEANRAFASVAAKEQFSCYFGPCFSPYLDLLAARGGADSEEAQAALREAFSVAQLVESPVVSAAINQLAARVGAGDEEISAYTRMQQDLGEQQIRLRAQLMQEFRKPEKKRSKDREQTIEKHIHQLQARIDEGELKMQDRFPKYARLVARKPVDAQRISELLQADEGLLYFSHVGDKGYTFLMHQGRLKLHAVKLTHEELRQKIAALRAGLTLESDKLRSFDAELAHALYRDLVGPLLDTPGQIRRLIVIPTGPLLSLPPDVLVSTKPGNKGKTAWLARQFSISVAPDVRALMNLRGIDKSATTASGFLGVGNPKFAAYAADKAPNKQASGPSAKNRGLHIVASSQIFAGDACAENWDVRAQVAQLAPLPESADEVRIMSAALGAKKGSLLLAEKATKSGLRKAGLETKDIIAFATHGLLPEDLYCENEPSLALAPGSPSDAQDDGLLRASEIAVMRLQASLVILSACNTAGADGRLGGESLSGLVRAFFYAGARNVLATHWPIASQPTVALTTGMVRKRAMGLTWSDALRESKVQMMDNPATSHPFFWGAFSLVGGG